ncbi:hypothetical protein ACRXCV_03290 [Halobacteriovorax sp. GFR7]|uniref:Mom family adenine methylcarbamoylation protein n=1 Tax=unclassified Halobacteriovorax TaxID=2639665 RepID=UPI003D95ABB4
MNKNINENYIKSKQAYENWKNGVIPKCEQIVRRQMHFEDDLEKFGLTPLDIMNLNKDEFEFRHIPLSDKIEVRKAKEFIKKYEYLRKLAQRNTHYFASYFKGEMVGVQVLSTPNMFSKILGEDTAKLEKVLSRGACNSISPPFLNSWQISKTIDWMSKNTESRLFYGYSDVYGAGERGIIYKASNFMYLGDNYGGKKALFDHSNPDKGIFSDREARKLAAYRRYANALGVSWDISWSESGRVNWGNIPDDVETDLRSSSRSYVASCEKIITPPKRKWLCIKGADRRETKSLLKRFYEVNPKFSPSSRVAIGGLPYPNDLVGV